MFMHSTVSICTEQASEVLGGVKSVHYHLKKGPQSSKNKLSERIISSLSEPLLQSSRAIGASLSGTLSRCQRAPSKSNSNTLAAWHLPNQPRRRFQSGGACVCDELRSDFTSALNSYVDRAAREDVRDEMRDRLADFDAPPSYLMAMESLSSEAR